jgi:hypothetical protein
VVVLARIVDEASHRVVHERAHLMANKVRRVRVVRVALMELPRAKTMVDQTRVNHEATVANHNLPSLSRIPSLRVAPAALEVCRSQLHLVHVCPRAMIKWGDAPDEPTNGEGVLMPVTILKSLARNGHGKTKALSYGALKS